MRRIFLRLFFINLSSTYSTEKTVHVNMQNRPCSLAVTLYGPASAGDHQPCVTAVQLNQ